MITSESVESRKQIRSRLRCCSMKGPAWAAAQRIHSMEASCPPLVRTRIKPAGACETARSSLPAVRPSGCRRCRRRGPPAAVRGEAPARYCAASCMPFGVRWTSHKLPMRGKQCRQCILGRQAVSCLAEGRRRAGGSRYTYFHALEEPLAKRRITRPTCPQRLHTHRHLLSPQWRGKPAPLW